MWLVPKHISNQSFMQVRIKVIINSYLVGVHNQLQDTQAREISTILSFIPPHYSTNLFSQSGLTLLPIKSSAIFTTSVHTS